MAKKSYAVKDNKIQEVDDKEVEFELPSPTGFFSSHVNLIPLQSSVQGPRLFYGARFYNQALPIKNSQSPLVQNLDDTDPKGRSFDEIVGLQAGALFADDKGIVIDKKPGSLTIQYATGDKKKINLYNNFPFNRKTSISQTALVNKGDPVEPGQILAKSNYTDDKGALALGLNARVGLVPFKGYSFEDALVVSQSFADRLSSDHSYTVAQTYDNDIKGGLNHYKSLFPTSYTKNQLSSMDDDGVIKPGTTVQPGDPLVLSTRPRVFSSSTSQLGKLSKAMRQSRHDASKVWEEEHPGIVTDVAKTAKGVKVQIQSIAPTHEGDKVVFRSGQKGVISQIVPDDQMPRTLDGKPLEVLLNPLGIPSRANNSMIYELLLGKVAELEGKPIKLKGFNDPGTQWHKIVREHLDRAGLSETEELFDPVSNKKLGQPVTVGVGHVLKLHHTSACFDDKTEVLTQAGWKLWKDVSLEDEIATTDTRGQRLFFERPLHLFSYDYSGELLGFSGRYVDYLVTPNHNMWCSEYFTVGSNFGLKQASELHNKRFQIRQGCFDILRTTPENSFILGSREFDWDDFCEFTGWWLTEGCVNNDNSGVLIYQSSSANPEKFKRIEDLLNRMKVSWSYYMTGGVKMGFAVNEKSFAEYFSNYGSHCQYKSVPRELIVGPTSGCERLIESIILGDGNQQQTATGPITRLSVTSKQLIDDFQELALRTGRASTVRYDIIINDSPEHHLPQHRASLTVSRGRSQVDGDRNEESFYTQFYTGKVYCAEMRTGLLIVRRNGKPMLSGNSKVSARGQAGYDSNEQPLKGGSEGAKAKRLSGLEVQSLLSAGAYANLREGSTLRGQKNDEFWRALRSGQTPKPPGRPFVWDKFQALLTGSGIYARSIGGGKLRLGPFTDDDLEARNPVEIQTGELVNINNLDPIKGGLFDQAIVGNNKWGKINLPFKVPNPAYEGAIRHLLGLTEKELRGILSGEMELPERLR